MRSKSEKYMHTWVHGKMYVSEHDLNLQLRDDTCSTCGSVRKLWKWANNMNWQINMYSEGGSPRKDCPDCLQKEYEKFETESMVHKWKLVGNLVRNQTTKEIEWWEACQLPGCTCRRLMKNKTQVQYYEVGGIRVDRKDRPPCGGLIMNKNAKSYRKEV